jgi:hypothetical protein
MYTRSVHIDTHGSPHLRRDSAIGTSLRLEHVLGVGLRYLGVDIVATVVAGHKANLTRYPVNPGDPTWEFGVLDMASEPIPDGYDLLFSRDALQHLNMNLVLDALENISKSKAKYFLVGSYARSKGNKNINMATCASPWECYMSHFHLHIFGGQAGGRVPGLPFVLVCFGFVPFSVRFDFLCLTRFWG